MHLNEVTIYVRSQEKSKITHVSFQFQLWMLSGPILIEAFLLHINHDVDAEFVDDLLGKWDYFVDQSTILVFNVAVSHFDMERFVHVCSWMITT